MSGARSPIGGRTGRCHAPVATMTAAGVDGALARGDAIAVVGRGHLRGGDGFADRSVRRARVGLEMGDEGVAGQEAVRFVAGVLAAGQPDLPVRA